MISHVSHGNSPFRLQHSLGAAKGLLDGEPPHPDTARDLVVASAKYSHCRPGSARVSPGYWNILPICDLMPVARKRAYPPLRMVIYVSERAYGDCGRVDRRACSCGRGSVRRRKVS